MRFPCLLCGAPRSYDRGEVSLLSSSSSTSLSLSPQQQRRRQQQQQHLSSNTTTPMTAANAQSTHNDHKQQQQHGVYMRTNSPAFGSIAPPAPNQHHNVVQDHCNALLPPPSAVTSLYSGGGTGSGMAHCNSIHTPPPLRDYSSPNGGIVLACCDSPSNAVLPPPPPHHNNHNNHHHSHNNLHQTATTPGFAYSTSSPASTTFSTLSTDNSSSEVNNTTTTQQPQQQQFNQNSLDYEKATTISRIFKEVQRIQDSGIYEKELQDIARNYRANNQQSLDKERSQMRRLMFLHYEYDNEFIMQRRKMARLDFAGISIGEDSD